VKEKVKLTWLQLQTAFDLFLEQRIAIGKLSIDTVKRYRHIVRELGKFLTTQNVKLVEDITPAVIEAFKVWRLDRIKEKKFSCGATGLVLDVAIMHLLFSFAVKRKIVSENPVCMEGPKPGENPQRGAEPFTEEELERLRGKAGPDMLAFLLLRWTGLRGSDAVSLTWTEINFDTKELEKLTQKRHKLVIIPIHSELLAALKKVHKQRQPHPLDRVLLNPSNGAPMTRPRLYQRFLAIGKRAGVEIAHPHRFRDTLAVTMLKNDGTIYDVAKILGDTVDTVEKHYAPFVKELRDRVRGILEKKPKRRVRIPSPTRHHNIFRKANSLSFKKITAGAPVSRILRTVFASSPFLATCRKQRTLKFPTMSAMSVLLFLAGFR
jgi:integrase